MNTRINLDALANLTDKEKNVIQLKYKNLANLKSILEKVKLAYENNQNQQEIKEWHKTIIEAKIYAELLENKKDKETAEIIISNSSVNYYNAYTSFQNAKLVDRIKERKENMIKNLNDSRDNHYRKQTQASLEEWKKVIDEVDSFRFKNFSGNPHDPAIEGLEIPLSEHQGRYNIASNQKLTQLKIEKGTDNSKQNSSIITEEKKSQTLPIMTMEEKINQLKSSIIDVDTKVTVWSWSRSFLNPKRTISFKEYLQEMSGNKANPEQKIKAEKILNAMNDEDQLKKELGLHHHGYNFMHISCTIGMSIFKEAKEVQTLINQEKERDEMLSNITERLSYK